MKRARKRAKAQEVKQKAPKRLKLLRKKSESNEMEQAMTGDEQMAIEMYEATQEKRRKVRVISLGANCPNFDFIALMLFCCSNQ